jgi:hypothetical protein
MAGDDSSRAPRDLPDLSVLWVVALVLASWVALLFLAPIARWPEPVVVVLTNQTDAAVLVDTRGWDGSLGVAGPVAETLAPGGTTTLRSWTATSPCVRVVDPATGRIGAASLAGATQRGDTVRVRVRRPTGDEPARPSLSMPCPAELADDRVRIGMGRYFESGNPGRILRERILGTH